MYLNKALVIGNLTRDPEQKALPSGIQVSSFSVATNRVWKDKNGTRQETPDYHNIVVFGKQAEIVGQYLKKGSSVLVEGRMQTRSWDGPDGQKRYRTEIVADRVQFGPRAGGAPTTGGSSFQKPASNEGGAPASHAAPQAGAPAAGGNEGFDSIQYPEEEINPEDIPF